MKIKMCDENKKEDITAAIKFMSEILPPIHFFFRSTMKPIPIRYD